jgi:hypothetical protein
VNLRELYVKPGDLIWLKWQALLRWLRMRQFIRKPGIRFRETPSGVEIIVKRRGSYPHPFRVSLSGNAFRISEGTLDGESVAIGDRFLDGRSVKSGVEGQKPTLEVGRMKSGTVRSWVVLHRAKSPEEPATISHVTERDPDAQPLALVHWTGGNGRVRQIVRHHLASGTSGARVYFWAV